MARRGLPQRFLDGDDRAELLARSENGLLAFRLNAAKAWESAAVTLPLSDVQGWNVPQYYQTIQIADLDGAKKAEVIARPSDGLHVYKLVPTSGPTLYLLGSTEACFHSDEMLGGDPPSVALFKALARIVTPNRVPRRG